MRPSLIALAASISTVSAVYQGFNYGATKSDGSFMYQADFEAKFKNAQNLVGTSGFSSARLYTMIQGGSSTNEPIQAIPAAINSGTSLLLGLWASGTEGAFEAEITALKSAIAQYGTKFTSLVAGISVGSEDLYRSSPTGVAANSGYGATPETLVNYISKVRAAIAGTSLSGASIGHVDTWTAWVDGSNSAVINAVDWIGVDAYPYYQNSQENDVANGKQLFDDALAATQAAVGSKEIWITETGWPVTGGAENKAVASTKNAETYWKTVGCPLFGVTNTWWYTQQDADPVTPNPSFGVVGSTLSTTPLYDLSCKAVSSSISGSSSATSVASSVVSSIASAATGGAIASSGAALGPSIVVPTYAFSTGVVGSGASYAIPTALATGGAGSGSGSSSGTNGTVVVKPTLSSTGISSGATSTAGSISANSASGISASFGAAGAVLVAALAAL